MPTCSQMPGTISKVEKEYPEKGLNIIGIVSIDECDFMDNALMLINFFQECCFQNNLFSLWLVAPET